jgi:hypothetical protein
MSKYFCRLSLLLVVALTATACAPVSRAQGLALAPTVSEAGPAASAPGPEPVLAQTESLAPPGQEIRVFQPQVMRVAQAEPAPPPRRVRFDLSLQPQLVSFFNQHAAANDIARVEHVSMIELLDQVTVGRKLVIFKNAADAEEIVPLIADRIDLIGYNLEGGPNNLPDEQADPIGSARRVRNLADAFGLKVALGPSRDFALHYGTEMSPYVDLFVLQVQRVQDEHETVRDFVLPLAAELRAANPDLELSVQIRTEGNVEQLVELVDSIAAELDAVSILTSQETLPTAMTLYDALDIWRRTPPPTPPATPEGTPPPTTAPTGHPGPGGTATPTLEPRRTPTQTPDPAVTRPGPPAGPDGLTRWFLFGSGLMFGLLLATLAGTWVVFLYQRTRTGQDDRVSR